jgi:peroxiredoxin
MKISFFKHLHKFTIPLFLLLANCSSTNTIAPTSKIKLAPNFSLYDFNNYQISLDSFKNKYVLVHFWASWCPSCVHELTTLENLYRFLNKEKFTILAVAIDDTKEAVAAIQAKYNFSFSLLLDESNTARNSYKVRSLPQSFLVNKDGSLISFIEPETGNLVSHTSGPQSWDKKRIF